MVDRKESLIKRSRMLHSPISKMFRYYHRVFTHLKATENVRHKNTCSNCHIIETHKKQPLCHVYLYTISPRNPTSLHNVQHPTEKFSFWVMILYQRCFVFRPSDGVRVRRKNEGNESINSERERNAAHFSTQSTDFNCMKIIIYLWDREKNKIKKSWRKYHPNQ